MTTSTSSRAPALGRARRATSLLLTAAAMASTAALVACTAPLPCDPLLATCLAPTTTGGPAAEGGAGAYGRAVLGLDGLLLWAPLDEAAGTVANDRGPKTAHGTISPGGVTYGAVDQVAAPGAGTRALRLAPGGTVSFPHRPELNLSTTTSSGWLVVLDARVDTTVGYPVLLSKGDWATNGYALFADPATGSLGLVVDGHQYAWGGVSLATTKHLAVGWDGSTLSFWVNGALIGRTVVTAAGVTNTSPMVVGKTGGVTVSKLAVTSRPGTQAVPGLYTTLTSPSSTTTAAPTTAAPTTTAAPKPTTTTAPAPAPAPSNGATLRWSDEFNGAAGSGVNPSTWEQQVGAPTNNGRVEYLTGGTQNVAMDGKGNLVITARQESYGGRSFTSGRIESYPSFTTGYLEFRAKVPTWQGTMPGLWTYGASGYGAGTGFSEIDALEIQTANDIDPTSVRQTIHGAMPDGQTVWQLGWSQNKVSYSPNRPGDAWHTYGAYVSPVDGSVTFYADGVPRTRYAKGQQPAGGGWPYGSVAQKIIIEIEMGGYSRYPTADRTSDTLVVDYVRVYDKPPY